MTAATSVAAMAAATCTDAVAAMTATVVRSAVANIEVDKSIHAFPVRLPATPSASQFEQGQHRHNGAERE